MIYTVIEAGFHLVNLSDKDLAAADKDGDGHITTNDAYFMLKPYFNNDPGMASTAGNSQYNLYVDCDRENIAAGDIINVVVYMDTPTDITSFQFEMCFDRNKLQYQPGTAACIGEAANVENVYLYVAEDEIQKGRGVLQFAGVYADRSLPAVLNGKVAFAQFKVINPEFEITIDGATNIFGNIGGISTEITDNLIIGNFNAK